MRLFRVTDPDGVQVSCTKEGWEKHILPRHPEVEGHERDVAKAIETPLGIYQSAKDLASQIFYAPSTALTPPYNRGFLRVVVTYRTSWGRRVGAVYTAHHAMRIKRGEVIIWPRAKR